MLDHLGEEGTTIQGRCDREEEGANAFPSSKKERSLSRGFSEKERANLVLHTFLALCQGPTTSRGWLDLVDGWNICPFMYVEEQSNHVR